MTRVGGTLKWFSVRDGTGMIRRGEGEADCQIRHSAMRGTIYRMLAPGQQVEFQIVDGTTGPAAWRVIKR